MASGLCKLCHGFKSLFCVQNGKLEWHRCPACDGRGTRNAHRGPEFINSRARAETKE